MGLRCRLTRLEETPQLPKAVSTLCQACEVVLRRTFPTMQEKERFCCLSAFAHLQRAQSALAVLSILSQFSVCRI